jgi:hypothetical protein
MGWMGVFMRRRKMNSQKEMAKKTHAGTSKPYFEYRIMEAEAISSLE